MIRHFYDDEKTALSDLRIVLGYVSASRLGSEAQADLALAKQRLSSLPGGDVIDLMVKWKLSGLTPTQPPVEVLAKQSVPGVSSPGHIRS